MPICGEPGEIVGRIEAAFRHDDAIARNFWRQGFAGGERRLEGPQVAIVDADQPRPQLQGALQFGLVVDFNQNVHAE